MKRSALLIGLLAGAVVVTTCLSSVVRASDPLSDEQIARVRERCFPVQSSLRRLHTSDTLLRVNMGQLYESISTKLMAPLNSRLSLNKFDSSAMVSSTVNYDRQLDAFRQSYRDYESLMVRTVAIDCSKHPGDFYESLSATRDARDKLHQDAVVLLSIIQQYRSDFDRVAESVAQ